MNDVTDRRENADGEIQKLVHEAVTEGRMIQLETLLYSNAQEPMTKVEIIELMKAQLAQLKRESKG